MNGEAPVEQRTYEARVMRLHAPTFIRAAFSETRDDDDAIA